MAILSRPRELHFWSNYSKETIVTDILGAFFRGQIIEISYTEKGEKNGSGLLNFATVQYVRIFKTPKILTDEQMSEFNANEKIGDECTSELIKDIRFDKASKQTKSLMEKLIVPPKKQIFVIMKFEDEYLDSAYKGVIRPLGEEFGYRVIRIDDIEDSGIITAQILESIAESEIVLADLSGARPNCYYETGVAYATGRELILTVKGKEKVHFDLSVHRFIRWKTESGLRKKLRRRLKAIQSKN